MNDYRITNTTDGKIVIRSVIEKRPSGFVVFSEEQIYVTNDAIKAIMQHMNSKVDDETQSVSYVTNGFGTLTWKPERKRAMWLPWKKKQKMSAPKVVEAPKTVEEQMNRMAAIGMSPDQIMQYQKLCEDIEKKSERMFD